MCTRLTFDYTVCSWHDITDGQYGYITMTERSWLISTEWHKKIHSTLASSKTVVHHKRRTSEEDIGVGTNLFTISPISLPKKLLSDFSGLIFWSQDQRISSSLGWNEILMNSRKGSSVITISLYDLYTSLQLYYHKQCAFLMPLANSQSPINFSLKTHIARRVMRGTESLHWLYVMCVRVLPICMLTIFHQSQVKMINFWLSPSCPWLT